MVPLAKSVRTRNGATAAYSSSLRLKRRNLRGLPSIDLNTKKADESQYERSDVCAVSAASVVMENAVAFEIARAFCDKFGGDSVTEMGTNYDTFLKLARSLPLEPPEMTIA